MKSKHPTISLAPHEHLWKIMNAEQQLLKEVWDNHHKLKKTRKSKRNQASSLIISEAHSSRLTLRFVHSIHFITEHSLGE